MSKVHINSTPLFKEVAAVIGERAAFIELGKVGIKQPRHFHRPLKSFGWNNTEQGFNFWYLISKGVNPGDQNND